MHKTHQHPGEELSGVSSHHAYKAGHDTLEDRLAFLESKGTEKGEGNEVLDVADIVSEPTDRGDGSAQGRDP